MITISQAAARLAELERRDRTKHEPIKFTENPNGFDIWHYDADAGEYRHHLKITGIDYNDI